MSSPFIWRFWIGFMLKAKHDCINSWPILISVKSSRTMPVLTPHSPKWPRRGRLGRGKRRRRHLLKRRKSRRTQIVQRVAPGMHHKSNRNQAQVRSGLEQLQSVPVMPQWLYFRYVRGVNIH